MAKKTTAVRRVKKKDKKVIKPLHLAHDEATKIYEHGALWALKVKRLKGRYLDLDKVLFTLGRPEEDDGNRIKAYNEIREELIGLGVQVTSNDNETEIIQFAKH